MSHRTYLPCHPSLTIPDPLSIVEEEWASPEVCQWKFVTTLLLRHPQPWKNWDTLEDVLTTLQNGFSGCGMLRAVLCSKGKSVDSFLRQTLPPMITLALRMPELFPSGEIPVLSPGSEATVSFSREEIACLLVHMFLCTIQPATWNKYWVNFHIWYDSQSPPVEAYLLSLLAYFEQLDMAGMPPFPQHKVSFCRCVLLESPNWHVSSVTLPQIKLSTSIDSESCLEVSFANKDIGFGTSGTQEECKMAQNPEACVAMLLCPTLQENEALVIRGTQKVCEFEGIGREVRFRRLCPVNSSVWVARTIIAIDASELDGELDSKCPIAELSEEVLKRDVDKAYCGFSCAVKHLHTKFNAPTQIYISTGHWGCGAFGGHMEPKALIQVTN